MINRVKGEIEATNKEEAEALRDTIVQGHIQYLGAIGVEITAETLNILNKAITVGIREVKDAWICNYEVVFPEEIKMKIEDAVDAIKKAHQTQINEQKA